MANQLDLKVGRETTRRSLIACARPGALSTLIDNERRSIIYGKEKGKEEEQH
jgi:hypothetical protein